MAGRLPSYDQKPWHRQFWPWFLIALPGSVVVAGLTTLYIASIHSDDLVDNNYYKDGLAINRVLEKDARAQRLGIEAKLLLSKIAENWQVQVQITGVQPDTALNLKLSHPLEADQDFVVQLAHSGPNVYTADLPRPVAAHWYWTIESESSTPWRIDGSIKNSDFGDEPGH